MRRAEINSDYRVHFVFEAEDYPDPPWPPYPNGTVPLIIDLTGDNEGAQAGDGYNPHTGNIVVKPTLDAGLGWIESNSIIADIVWDSSTFTFSLIESLVGDKNMPLIEDIVQLMNDTEEE